MSFIFSATSNPTQPCELQVVRSFGQNLRRGERFYECREIFALARALIEEFGWERIREGSF